MAKTNKISKILKVAMDAGLLKRVTRTGWQKKNIKDPESVAEHSFRVAVLAMLLAPEFDLDQAKLMKMALIHDLGESVIGDLIWEKGGKVIGSQSEKHKDESKAIQQIFDQSGHLEEYINIWKEYEEQETKEAKLLKQIDKLEMVIQALEYEEEGVSSEKLQEFWDNVQKYLEDTQLQPYFERLEEIRLDLNSEGT